jgi:hypothetical protein
MHKNYNVAHRLVAERLWILLNGVQQFQDDSRVQVFLRACGLQDDNPLPVGVFNLYLDVLGCLLVDVLKVNPRNSVSWLICFCQHDIFARLSEACRFACTSIARSEMGSRSRSWMVPTRST